MDNKLKQILIKRILDNIPSHFKPIDFLMDILDLSRESVYRRLKGSIDFTFSESIKLGQELNFSLDELYTEYDLQLASFEYQKNRISSPEKYSIEILENYEKMMYELESADGYIVNTLNRLLWLFLLPHSHLTKFVFYKWIHQFDTLPLDFAYNELILNPRIIELCKNIISYDYKLENIMIIDKNIFLKTVQEIKYYRDRGLILPHEISLIKNDIQDLLESTQQILQTGITDLGNPCTIYLSSINIDTNSLYMRTNNKEIVYYYIFSDSNIQTSNPNICKMHSNWLDSLKKYSTLISASNQKMQAEFINQQFKFLDEI